MPEFNLPKTYDFKSVEQRIYAWWEQSGYFKPPMIPISQVSIQPENPL